MKLDKNKGWLSSLERSKNMVENALAYVMRKKTRTLIIFTLICLVLSALYACLAILQSSDQVQASLYQSSNSSLTIKRKEGGGRFQVGDLSWLKEDPSVQSLVYQYEGLAQTMGSQPVTGDQKVNRDDLASDLENLLSLQAISQTDRDPLFTSGVFTLVKGRGIQEGDQHKALVHQDFAQANKLDLGDKLSLQMLDLENDETMANPSPESEGSPESQDNKNQDPEDEGSPESQDNENQNPESQDSSESQDYEIVGIFSGKKQENYTGLSSDLSENMVYTDYASSQAALHLKGSKQEVSQIAVFAKGPDQLDQISKKLDEIGGVADKFQLEENTEAYETAQASLAGIRQIIQVMTLAILIAGALALSLILILWLRERIYEIGVLLTIGFSKLQVIGQFILELILVSLPGLLISFLLGRMLLNQVLGQVLSVPLLQTDFGLKQNLLILGQSYGILLLIIVLSVFVASAMILVKKPKAILSQMS